MKRMLLFSLIGALILFSWQFLSFAFPNFHKSANTYTSKQDTILNKLKEIGLEEGMYLLGQADPALSHDEQMKQHESYSNKPWASINYKMKNSMDMTMPMIRGILVCFVISMFLYWAFSQQKSPTLKNRVLLSLSIGLIGFFFIPYSNFIWYKEPDIFAYFLDGIAPWLIMGFIGHKIVK